MQVLQMSYMVFIHRFFAAHNMPAMNVAVSPGHQRHIQKHCGISGTMEPGSVQDMLDVYSTSASVRSQPCMRLCW
jgi:hypothetical protein